MLTELRIQNFAIIDQLELKLEPGLLMFTGETGAGKSIMIDAVEFLVGGRADSDVVRTGTETALLEAAFHIDPSVREQVHNILTREEVDDGADDILVSREIRLAGRNICRVNGRVVTLSLLREIGDLLVDVHGQSEHLSLLRVRHHRELLDRFAGADEVRKAYVDAYDEWREVSAALHDLQERDQEAAQRADYLEFQIEEIEAARLEVGEDEELQSERSRLANAEKLASLSEAAVAALDEGLQGEISASDLLGQAVENIDELADVDEGLDDLRDEAQALSEQVLDLARRIRSYGESVEYNPRRLNEVEERLALIGGLKRKYGGSVEEILEHAERARQELDEITNAEERIEELQTRSQELLHQIGQRGEHLSNARREAADELAEGVERELEELQMAGARFNVRIEQRDDPQGAFVGDRRIAFDRSGLDDVEFMVAPNPGEGPKPLVKIASGGETSRLMLALKGVLAEADETPTLIFDEIDQGIGGRVGAVVGRKLAALSEGHQVLCITHLPQMAAYGSTHYSVDKEVHDGRTVTRARRLDESQRVTELAVMLGGANEPNRESARALLEEAAGSEKALQAG
ncbi:MAG: DNA repair protein RecN [Anaerolineales bacterium]|nr:DNA repair protein RecN [Anaerolineales bacterium]